MKDYYIEFSNVKKDGSPMVAMKISIGSEIITNMHAPMNIALCDDPLYPKLEQYVRANPSGKHIAPEKPTKQ